MKNRIILSACTLMIAVTLFSCADDKKAASNEATTASASENAAAASKTSTASAFHPTEQKLYDFTSAYMVKIEAAVAEPDDNKAIAMLNSINSEMKSQAEALKPELTSWVKSLSESERKAFGERMMEQPSTAKAYKLMGDPKLAQRLNKNPKFREAFEKANNEPTQVWNTEEATSEE